MPTKIASLTTALQKAIKASGIAVSDLAKQTNVSQPTITRFLDGEDIRLSAADKLAQYLGLQLQAVEVVSDAAKPRATAKLRSNVKKSPPQGPIADVVVKQSKQTLKQKPPIKAAKLK